MELTAAQRDRACGALLATAAGDALGAPFEFGGPLGPEVKVAIDDEVSRRSIWQTGEWTDDTSMAIAIAEVAAAGVDLRGEAAQDAIVRRWHQWAYDPDTKDVGVQTRHVLTAAAERGISAATARAASEELHQATGRSAGDGALMRTAPAVVLLYKFTQRVAGIASRADRIDLVAVTVSLLPPRVTVVPDVAALDLKTDNASTLDRDDEVHLMVLEVVGDTLAWDHQAALWKLFQKSSVDLPLGLVGKAGPLLGSEGHSSAPLLFTGMHRRNSSLLRFN